MIPSLAVNALGRAVVGATRLGILLGLLAGVSAAQGAPPPSEAATGMRSVLYMDNPAATLGVRQPPAGALTAGMQLLSPVVSGVIGQ